MTMRVVGKELKKAGMVSLVRSLDGNLQRPQRTSDKRQIQVLEKCAVEMPKNLAMSLFRNPHLRRARTAKNSSFRENMLLLVLYFNTSAACPDVVFFSFPILHTYCIRT